eukprot:139587_1
MNPDVIRSDAGKSNWCDERKMKWRLDQSANVLGLDMKISRKDKKMMEPGQSLETFISIPQSTGKTNDDGATELEFFVELDGEPTKYCYTQDDILTDYPYTCAKLVEAALKTKQIDSTQIDSMIQPLHYSTKLGSVCWLKNPSADTQNDRVVIVSGYNKKSTHTFSWLQSYVPKYEVKHVDHKAPESDTFTISTHLNNGKQLHDGGIGWAGDNDLEVIIANVDADVEEKYNYLRVKIYIYEYKMRMLKSHCRTIAMQEMNRVSSKLKHWLCPKYGNEDKQCMIDMSMELQVNEFNQLFVSRGGKSVWNGTKRKQLLSVGYDESIGVFGDKSIVKTFRPTRGDHFILSITDLTLTFFPQRSRMKLEAFVQHVWK